MGFVGSYYYYFPINKKSGRVGFEPTKYIILNEFLAHRFQPSQPSTLN